MILGAEHKLPCGCRVVYVLNGTVCVNHEVKYCDTHSGAELARLQQEIIRQEVCSAELLRSVNTLQAKHDSLLAESRRMWEALQCAEKFIRDAVLASGTPDEATPITAIRNALLRPHTTREVERVKALEDVMRTFADRPCGASVDNSNCAIELREGRLERKCYSCEAREAIDKVSRS